VLAIASVTTVSATGIPSTSTKTTPVSAESTGGTSHASSEWIGTSTLHASESALASSLATHTTGDAEHHAGIATLTTGAGEPARETHLNASSTLISTSKCSLELVSELLQSIALLLGRIAWLTSRLRIAR
jgi:hypothetical protein